MDTRSPLSGIATPPNFDLKTPEVGVVEVRTLTPPPEVASISASSSEAGDAPVAAAPAAPTKADLSNHRFYPANDENRAFMDDVGAKTSQAPAPMTNEQKTEKILQLMERYRMKTPNGVFHAWLGRSNVRTQVLNYINNNETIRMILPAFPCKSPNKKTKVLGDLPDAAEEVALHHMQALCTMIRDVYSEGANLHLVSDGLCYNDIMGVSDREVWRYGKALRELAQTQQCLDIKFVRLVDLLHLDDEAEPLDEETYLANAPKYRQTLVDKFTPENFDADVFIKSESDALLTYRGYLRFLERDLEFLPQIANQSKAQRTKHFEATAKRMITRGKAFAAAIKGRFADFIRLSIHPSVKDASKLSISVVPQTQANPMTPWHSCLVRAVDGTVTMAHANSVSAVTHELIFDSNGRPSYFRERSPLFRWPGMPELTFEYLYPTGIIVRPASPRTHYSLHNVHMQKLRELGERCSPVILRGFEDTTDERTFKAKAHDAGEVYAWPHGVLIRVKDVMSANRGTSNASSAEPLPYHYDGIFASEPVKNADGTTKVDADGKEIRTSTPPQFQLFTSLSNAPKGSGYTLFASSRLFFQNLPQMYSLEELERLSFTVRASEYWGCHITGLPLVQRHPTTNEPCIRWHEPWGMHKTKFAYFHAAVENAAAGNPKRKANDYSKLIQSLLYDRRVALYFEWEEGDVLLSDNFSMMHTRTGFDGTCDRELWRIHLN